MPLHDYACKWCDEVQERFVSVEDLDEPQRCHCGLVMERVYLKFPMSFVQPDICYDSPIDGRPITSKHARIEDMKRSDCVEYDPSMKSYAERRRKEEDAALERAIDETVEREIHTMPARKRERLAAELEGGQSVEYTRATPEAA